MNKLTLPLSLLAAATLAACGNQPARTTSSEPVVYSFTSETGVRGTDLRPGSGKVAYVSDPTGPVNGISTQLVILHMEDGTSQTMQRRGTQLALGEHVRLRSDNTVRRDPMLGGSRATE